MNETIVNFLLFITMLVAILLVAYFNSDQKGSSLRTTEKRRINRTTDTTNRAYPTISKIDVIFNNIIDFLKADDVYFRYGKNKVEKDYQQDLEHKLALLKEKFGYDCIYETKNGKHRIDFVIDDKIGIEMKVHKGGTQVEKELFYQITKYGNLYPKMIGLVINDSDKDDQELRNEIKTRLKDQNVLEGNDYEIVVIKPIGKYQ